MGWIGVDFDGTLAQMHSRQPVPRMVRRVKEWINAGKDVRILTASYPQDADYIAKWLKQHVGKSLPITNKKDHDMMELWDDKAVQVIPNTGERADGRG